MFLFPFYYMVIGSFQAVADKSARGVLPHPDNMTVTNYEEINDAIDPARALLNSGIFTGGVLAGTIVFGLLAGYALARDAFPRTGTVFAIVLLVLVIPFQLLMIPLYVLIVRSYGLGDTYIGMILPFAINSTAVFIFRQFFLQLPRSCSRPPVSTAPARCTILRASPSRWRDRPSSPRSCSPSSARGTSSCGRSWSPSSRTCSRSRWRWPTT